MKNFQNEIKYWIYLFSWLGKLTIYVIIKFIKERKKIDKKALRLVSIIMIWRKVHFLLFNLVVIDVAFTGTRTLLHVKIKREIAYEYFLTAFCYFLIVIDTLEIIHSSSNIIVLETKKLKKEKLMIVAQKLKEDSSSSKVVAKVKNAKSVGKTKNLKFIKNSTKLKSKKKKNRETTSDLDNSTIADLIFKDHEKDKVEFIEKKKNGFGLRKFFWEDEMLEYVMDAETATRLGYVRVMDYERSHKLLLSNSAI